MGRSLTRPEKSGAGGPGPGAGVVWLASLAVQ